MLNFLLIDYNKEAEIIVIIDDNTTPRSILYFLMLKVVI